MQLNVSLHQTRVQKTRTPFHRCSEKLMKWNLMVTEICQSEMISKIYGGFFRNILNPEKHLRLYEISITELYYEIVNDF